MQLHEILYLLSKDIETHQRNDGQDPQMFDSP